MNRNWYALVLLLLLSFTLWSSGRYMDTSFCAIEQGIQEAYSCATVGNYDEAREKFYAVAQRAEDYTPVWLLLVRRNLIDQLNQTLATIPSYATQENVSDLAVETARAKTQAEQIRRSFFSWF